MPRSNAPLDYPGDAGARRNARYDDDYDNPRSRRVAEPHPTTMGMIGFILSIVSVGLLVIVILLWIALKHEENNVVQRTRLILYWFGILDVMSFFTAVTAIIFSARGLVPSNPLYRGWSVAGLVLGIVNVIVTIVFGMFMGIAILCFEALAAGA